ncbi:MAG: ATP synthase beta chain, partial [uncultured Gemmatimonadaceae bacterium]
PHPRGRPAHRRQPRPRDRHAAHRRARPRRRRPGHRLGDRRARRRRHQGPRLQRPRPAARRRQRRRRHLLADPPAVAGVRPAREQDGDLPDRHQGHRPAGAVRRRWQDRPVRRCGRRQDGPHPGDDLPRRQGVLRRLGVRRRRRAHPRGQRPVRGDDRVGRHRRHRAGVRADGRAAGHPAARRAVGADDGGVLPRRAEAGRAAVHRQHLPLHPGRVGGVDAARPHAQRRRLPADPGRRDGRAAGADHLDARSLDHLAAGDLRPRRRHHRPGAAHDVHPPGRHHGARPVHRRAGHLPGRRPARLHQPHPRPPLHRRRALRRRTRGAAHPAALQGPAGHHRDPRHRRARRGGQGPGQPGPSHPALPVAAVLRRRGLHRPARQVRPDRGDDRVVQEAHRGRLRPHPRAGVLPVRWHRGRRGQRPEARGL